MALSNSNNNFIHLHECFLNSLKKSFKAYEVNELKNAYDSIVANEIDKKAALDQCFRDILMNNISDITQIEAFIDFSIEICRLDMVQATIPVILLGDFFDATTLDKCEIMFNYVEKNVAIWKEKCFFSSCKNNLLRMCNDLLRRLSRSQNTVFCGRILLFLAKFFPFSERSGLNIVSEFNLDNLTEYDGESKDMGEISDDITEDMNVKIDYNLYCKFWALQDYFRNPNQCYIKSHWKTFSSHASSVLAAFSSFKLEETRDLKIKSLESGNIDAFSMDIENALRNNQHFFAKFLTNPKLLSLQLADSNFRRSVLVQFLILFQYLTSNVKFKAESFALIQAQIDWIKQTDSEVYKLLQETPPHGKKFAVTVQHMLQREELWNNWKNDGCKEFKRPGPLDEDAELKSVPKKQKKLLGDSIRDANKHGKFYMGNPELTKLWNVCPDNLQACKGSDRDFLPSLESYLENPREKGDPSYEWRALRLLARQSPHFFTLLNTPSYKVSDYLDSVRKRIQKDRTEIKQESQDLECTPSVEQIEGETEVFGDDQIEESELLKTEQLTPEDENSHKPTMVTPDQLLLISPIIGGDWKKLATKLGYSVDLILFFETENAKTNDQCKAMLQIWFDEDMDASLDNLAYILEGLGMISACETVKKFIPNNDKVEDISD